jgi:hypothetical protein
VCVARPTSPGSCGASTSPGSPASVRRQIASKAASPLRRSPPRPLRRSFADGGKASHKPEAARGQVRAQQLFSKLLSDAEYARALQTKQRLDTALNYKLRWEDELDRRKRLGIEGPEPVPHPDDIHIDLRTGEIRFTGPMTRRDKAILDHAWDVVEEADREIERLTDQLKKHRSKMMRNYLEANIAIQKSLRDPIVARIGEPSKRRRG